MNYIGNVRQWKQLIEVDWLGQYVKAWVAFNAWYSNNFKPSQGNKRLGDREIIERIKNDEGDICSKIENFLSQTGSDQKSFQSHVADLHNALSVVPVKSNGKRIWLEEISDYHYVKSINDTRNNIKYEIEINRANKTRVVKVSGRNPLNKTITEAQEEFFRGEEWFERLSDSGWFEQLSRAQRNNLRPLLEATSPIHNLLVFDNTYTEVGSYNFTSDKKLIARALIEILYQLRNALFHGEVTPNEVQTVYQPAYLVLKQIIPEV